MILGVVFSGEASTCRLARDSFHSAHFALSALAFSDASGGQARVSALKRAVLSGRPLLVQGVSDGGRILFSF